MRRHPFRHTLRGHLVLTCGHLHVHITDPEYTDDLAAFLRRCECTVRVVGPGLLDADVRPLPISASLRRPELELGSYVSIWCVLRRTDARLAAASG